MFGRPKFSDSAFLLKEISNGFAVTSIVMESEHPDASNTDVQAIMVWVFALILHAVLTWGRTDEKAIFAAFSEFGAMMQQNEALGTWDLEELSSEIERCQRLLRMHVSRLDHDESKEASAAFYRGFASKNLQPNLSEEDYVKFGVTTILAVITRLRNSGHIKL